MAKEMSSEFISLETPGKRTWGKRSEIGRMSLVNGKYAKMFLKYMTFPGVLNRDVGEHTRQDVKHF